MRELTRESFPTFSRNKVEALERWPQREIWICRERQRHSDVWKRKIIMSRKQKRAFRPSLLLIALTLAAITLVSARAHKLRPPSRAQMTSTTEKSASAVSALPQSGSPQEAMEAELITVLPNGFEPAEIRRPAGKFLLAIDNRSGLPEINLSLVRVAGNSVQDLRIRREKPDLRKVVELGPGAYLLTEANHPGWIGRLIITVP